MKDDECIAFLQQTLPQLRLRWPGFRRVRRQVCKRLGRRLQALGLAGLDSYRTYLQEHPAEWGALDKMCWITISRFSRDRCVFHRLEHEVLPVLAHQVLARGERDLHAWSAGCASGEEPYTLALLWAAGLASRFPELDFRILATDAAPLLLERARRGRYPEGNLRELPMAWRAHAFERAGDTFQLDPVYREAVTFLRQDIRHEMPEGWFHLVLCRNLVFTYFDEELQREILSRLHTRLVPGGVLVVGAHEKLPEGDYGFEPWLREDPSQENGALRCLWCRR